MEAEIGDNLDGTEELAELEAKTDLKGRMGYVSKEIEAELDSQDGKELTRSGDHFSFQDDVTKCQQRLELLAEIREVLRSFYKTPADSDSYTAHSNGTLVIDMLTELINKDELMKSSLINEESHAQEAYQGELQAHNAAIASHKRQNTTLSLTLAKKQSDLLVLGEEEWATLQEEQALNDGQADFEAECNEFLGDFTSFKADKQDPLDVKKDALVDAKAILSGMIEQGL